MSKPECFCEACGAKVVEYRHRLNAPLVNALGKLYLAGGEAHKNDLRLTTTQYGNFQKLRYWFLVEMVRDEDGHVYSGVWRLTERGQDFVEGRITIPETVWTFRGEHLRYEGSDVSFADVHDNGVERAEDYWANATPHFLE